MMSQSMEEGFNSEHIVAECRRFHGWGERFPRTDGLEHEARREQLRLQYLGSHPQTRPVYHEAITAVSVMPGMTKAEAGAAWGLIGEDVRDVGGHMTAIGQTVYAYFEGFELGERYGLYLIDELIVGVRCNLRPIVRRDRELEMEVARTFLGLDIFEETEAGELAGTEEGADKTNIEMMYYHLMVPYTGDRRIIPPFSVDLGAVEEIEFLLKREGLFAEYVRALASSGLSLETASAAERCRAALSIGPKNSEV